MILGNVIGNVVSTRKDDRLVGTKLLVVRKLSEKLEPMAETLVAVDTVGAGVGEIVLMVSGSSARQALDNKESPIDLTIVGIVDTVEVV